MATTIVQAVLQRWVDSANTDFTASGGLWFVEVPELKTLPVFIYTQPTDETTEYTTELPFYEIGQLQFDIFAVTVAEAERLALRAKAIFDACTKNPGLLSIDNARVTEWERTGYRPTVADFRDLNDKQVGQATMTYRYRVKRELPA